MLDAGEIDVAIGVPPTSPPGRIIMKPLFGEHFVCAMRRDHPAAARPWDLATFLEYSHLLVSPENERFGHVDVSLAKLGLKRRLALTLPQMYAAPMLVAGSNLIATLMAGVVEASGLSSQLVTRKPPLDLDVISFIASWHWRNDTHPAHRWFVGTISDLCNSLGGRQTRRFACSRS